MMLGSRIIYVYMCISSFRLVFVYHCGNANLVYYIYLNVIYHDLRNWSVRFRVFKDDLLFHIVRFEQMQEVTYTAFLFGNGVFLFTKQKSYSAVLKLDQ